MSTDTIPSGETTQLPVQGGVCGRLQQIPPREERRPLHRVQPARDAAAAWQESPDRTSPQVLLIHEASSRLRHQPTQHQARRRLLAQVALIPTA